MDNLMKQRRCVAFQFAAVPLGNGNPVETYNVELSTELEKLTLPRGLTLKLH